ncbi:hypothetical protein N7G274_002966 [Stereocaulon virgatum]|uniref:Uncharacterized protein n=1 Tax=Stereocaulon virgatum TaxID=373712 RepID=A0ABR4AFH2_9LECA
MTLSEGTLGVLKAVSSPLVGLVADPIATLLLEELVDIALGPDVETMFWEAVGGKLEDVGTLLLTLVEKVLDAAIEIGLSVFVEASVGPVAATVLSSLDKTLNPLGSTILLVLERGMLDTMNVTAPVPLIKEVLDLIVDIRLLVLAKKVPDAVVGTLLLMLVRVALDTVSVGDPMLLVEETLGAAVDMEVLSNVREPLFRMVIKVLLSPAEAEVVPTFERRLVALTEEKLEPSIVKVALVLGEDTVPKSLVVEIPSESMLEMPNTIVDITVVGSVVEAIVLTPDMLELSLGEVLVLLVPNVETMVTFPISEREEELEDPSDVKLSLVEALKAFPPRVEINVLGPMAEEVTLGLLIEPLAARIEVTVRGLLVDRAALISLMETSVNPLVELLATLVEVIVTGPVKDNTNTDPLVEGPVIDSGPDAIVEMLVSVLKVSIVEKLIVTEAALEAFIIAPLVKTGLNGLKGTSDDENTVTGAIVEAVVLGPPVVGPAANREVLDPLIVTLPFKIAEVAMVRGLLFAAVVPGPLVKEVSLAFANITSVPDVLGENIGLDWLNRLPLLEIVLSLLIVVLLLSNVVVVNVALDEIASIVLSTVPPSVAVPSLLEGPGTAWLTTIVFPPDKIYPLVNVLTVTGTVFDWLAEILLAVPELLLLVKVMSVLALVEAGFVRVVLLTRLALVESALEETLLILEDMLPLVTPSLTILDFEFIGTLLLVELVLPNDRLIEILLMLAEILALFTVVLILAELLPLARVGLVELLLTLVEIVILVIVILTLVEMLPLAGIGLAVIMLALPDFKLLLTVVLMLAEILRLAGVGLVELLLTLVEIVLLVIVILTLIEMLPLAGIGLAVIILALPDLKVLLTVVLILAELVPLADIGLAVIRIVLAELKLLLTVVLMLAELLPLADIGLAVIILALTELEALLIVVLMLAKLLSSADVALIKVLSALAELL